MLGQGFDVPICNEGNHRAGNLGYLGMGSFLPSETTEEYYLLTPEERKRQSERKK